MRRLTPTFREVTLSNEEANSFLDEMFANLFDSDDISCDSDKIPDLNAVIVSEA